MSYVYVCGGTESERMWHDHELLGARASAESEEILGTYVIIRLIYRLQLLRVH